MLWGKAIMRLAPLFPNAVLDFPGAAIRLMLICIPLRRIPARKRMNGGALRYASSGAADDCMNRSSP